MDLITLALAKKYVEQTAVGLGAVRGAPCTIQSITDSSTEATITFRWTGTDGSTNTSALVLKHGKDGSSASMTVQRNAADSGVVITTENPDGTTSQAELKDGSGFPTSDIAPTAAGNVGDIVLNGAPEPGGWVGWVYTPVGWHGFGEISVVGADVPEGSFLTADGVPFTLSDGTIFLYADS